MIVGSAFTGVGGIDLGLERAGMRVVWQCESDDRCRCVLAKHWADIPCFGDVRNLSRAAGATPVDLFVGGVPCQDWSIAGLRAGLAGARSGLFFEFARVADELVRPGGWILFENVTGLLSAHRGRDFAVVVRTLGDIGFHDLAWRVLDSRYFGVPQRRRRIFIVARRATGSGAREVLLEPESGGGNFAPSHRATPHVAASLSRGSHSDGVSPSGRRQEDDENIIGSLNGHKQRGGWRIGADEAAAGQLVAGTVRSHARPGSNDNGAVIAPAIVRRYGKGTDSDASDALIAHTLRAEGFDASEDGTGRGTPLTIAGTIGGGDNGSGRRSEFDPNLVCAPADSDRMRTAAGLPRWVDDPQPDGPRYSEMGNAVTVPVAEWIGRRLMEHTAGNPQHSSSLSRRSVPST